MDDFTMNQSELGSARWSLKARTALLVEGDHQALLTHPLMEFFKEGRTATRVSALGGVVRTDTTDVRLSSSVVVTSLDDNSVLKTDQLFYLADKKKFFTDSAVAVYRPGGVLHGRGLEANPDLSEIHIFHQTSVIEKGMKP